MGHGRFAILGTALVNIMAPSELHARRMPHPVQSVSQERAALALFDAAFDREPNERDAWLAAQCGDDAARLARMQHPAIARILDGGSAANGLHFLVMEFVNGLAPNIFRQ